MEWATMNRLDVGDSVRLVATFKDFDGVARDPATVTLRVRKPSGEVLRPAVLHPQPGSGTYYAELVLDEAGWWVYEWETTGVPTVVEGGEFHVSEKRIP
jgi:uncharacterized protein YfaS (alpha-2-macroglobulin family)